MEKKNGPSPIPPATQLIRYLKMYEESPDSLVFIQLADTYRRLGLLKESFRLLEKEMPRHPKAMGAVVCLARCFWDQEQYLKIINLISPHLKNNLSNIQLLQIYLNAAEKIGIREYVDEVKQALSAQMTTSRSSPAVSATNLFNELELEPSLANENAEEQLDNWVAKSFAPVEETLPLEEDIPALQPSPQSIPQSDSTPTVQPMASPMITFTLAEIYVSQGHFIKALEVMHKFLELAPEDKRIIEKINEIQNAMKEKSLQQRETEEIKQELSQTESAPEDDQDYFMFGKPDENKKESENEEKESGHNELMAVFDSRIKVDNSSNDRVKMAFGLFLQRLKEHQAVSKRL